MTAILTRNEELREPIHKARVRFATKTSVLVVAMVVGVGLLLAYIATIYG